MFFHFSFSCLAEPPNTVEPTDGNHFAHYDEQHGQRHTVLVQERYHIGATLMRGGGGEELFVEKKFKKKNFVYKLNGQNCKKIYNNN